MPAARYKVMAVGPQVAATATAPVYVGVAGVGKKALPGQPYIVSNELICSYIAKALLLPCPPGALMESGNITYFFSLDFNLAGQALPPVTPAVIAQNFPELSWGIIVFDALVMNSDRHTQNIAHDTTTDRIQIFDHSHAYMGQTSDVSTLLNNQATNLGIGGHCLAGQIETSVGLQVWLDKVSRYRTTI